ncbi:PREDICTED: fasciclin-like arabinogalactan protein 21 [Nicotiana attenuata]|uniref:Fasciclin-like arabinogalactan protein 21 n=1 Tax=Nicotiana attenuata TaxID=49451 RepID=A0A1J6IPZ6_NICAT|nr:PREDICTED: fasciclin-like arabinogalactan protein 21 [Nicotiana attenuata]OIT07261.1 fasciclin-like arabinogalactan protein 21 [Nicotiana attenuata]
MASSGCQGLFFILLSIILALTAITTSMHSKTSTKNSNSSHQFLKHALTMNASKALRNQGFNILATLLQISPEIFLSTPQSTIFAVQDSAISKLSLPSWAMKQLLQYHTSPSKLPFQQLLIKSKGSCLTTLLSQKTIAITKTDIKHKSVEINNVLVSHPDLFLEESLSIHGVTGAFSDLDFHAMDEHSDIIQSPICENQISNASKTDLKNLVDWPRIIKLLSSKGYVSFAIELHSVLDGVFQDSANLSSVTIFAPPNLGFLSSPSPLLERIVRLHIMPQRYTYMELAFLPDNSSLKTLAPGLNVTISKSNFSRILTIDGVEITAPDIFVSKTFIIHGISRVFELEELSISFR